VSTVLRPDGASTWTDPAQVAADATVALPRQPVVNEPLFSARWKHATSWVGRVAAVALPSGALAHPHHAGIVFGVALTLLVIVFWWVPLRMAYNTSLRALGAAPPAAVGTGIGLVLVSALALWLPLLELGPLTLLNVAALTFLLATGWEMLVQKHLARRQRVLVLGGERVASDLAAEAARDRDGKLEVVGLVADSADVHVHEPPLLGTLAQLGEVVEAQQPDLIVLADGDPGPAVDRLLESSWRKFRVVGVSYFFEHAFGRVPLTHISPAWFMGILHLRQPSYDGWSKRAFDLVVAATGLVIAAPFLVVIALAVRLSGPPVLFTQTRLGERGKRFRMYKFRTMIPSGEPDGQARWAEELDPRVTRIGRFLRRTRLDELPQLWNVLRGEMSIVGPRPERPEFMRVLEEKVPFWNRRLLVKPGVTGWAQIRSGYAADHHSTMQKLSYDLWYVRHRTLLLDLLICARTLATVVSGAGAR
jgi:exopolysaccharide biosynthesis polyprenyl glycosylphosphotransferase